MDHYCIMYVYSQIQIKKKSVELRLSFNFMLLTLAGVSFHKQVLRGDIMYCLVFYIISLSTCIDKI